MRFQGPVIQGLEYDTFNIGVGSSNLPRPTIVNTDSSWIETQSSGFVKKFRNFHRPPCVGAADVVYCVLTRDKVSCETTVL